MFLPGADPMFKNCYHGRGVETLESPAVTKRHWAKQNPDHNHFVGHGRGSRIRVGNKDKVEESFYLR